MPIDAGYFGSVVISPLPAGTNVIGHVIVDSGGGTGTQTVTIAGSVTIAETPSVAVIGTVSVVGEFAAPTGTQTVVVAGTSTVEISGIAAGTIQLAGTSTVTIAGSVATTVPTGTQTVTVAGSVTLAETPSIAVIGTSTVEVAGIAGGTIQVAGISGGTVQVAGTSTVAISGAVATTVPTGTQTVVVAGTSTVQIAGISAGTVQVAGIAGTSTVEISGIAAGTVQVAGISGGTIQVSGVVGTSTVEVAGIAGGTVQISGVVGTSTVEIAGIAAGTVQVAGTSTTAVEGFVASGSPVVGNPVLAGGSDGVDVRTFLTDNTGQQKVLIENNPTVGVAGTSTVEVAGIAGGTVQVSGVVGTSTVEIAGIAAGTVQVAGTSTVEISGIAAGTVAVAGTSTVNLTGQVAGPVAAGTAASSSVLHGLVYNSSAPSLTSGQQVATQGDAAGSLFVRNYRRSQISAYVATLTSTHTVTLVGALTGSTFADILALNVSVVNPTATASATVIVSCAVVLSDGTASYTFGASSASPNDFCPSAPIPATSSDTAWTVRMLNAVYLTPTVYITALVVPEIAN